MALINPRLHGGINPKSVTCGLFPCLIGVGRDGAGSVNPAGTLRRRLPGECFYNEYREVARYMYTDAHVSHQLLQVKGLSQGAFALPAPGPVRGYIHSACVANLPLAGSTWRCWRSAPTWAARGKCFCARLSRMPFRA